MTTKLEAVLAEEWHPEGRDIALVGEADLHPLARFYGLEPHASARRAIAVLGKRALKELLAIDALRDRCQSCGRHRDESGEEHRDDCEWGRICAAAKEIG